MERVVTVYTAALVVLAVFCAPVAAQIDVTVSDMTPTKPLQKPLPSAYQPRYISGFGSGNSFTLFFEDRGSDFAINYIWTTSGPTGFPVSATVTDISETHFCVKDWPITIDSGDCAGTYAYRAWGAPWENADHHFYVSNNLETWEMVSTFTIPNFKDFHSGYVYYGFHDVIELNGTYYAWGEGNIGHTLMCRSANGADDWEAFARVGGLHTLSNVGPLGLPDVGTPTGSFFELGGDRGYGKIMVAGNDSAFYLAINTAARPNLEAEALETAFIDPDNWTWHDGTTGLASTPILEESDEHDLRECWMVSNSDTTWTIIYDADYGSGDGGKALGYAILSIPVLYLEVDIDIKPGSSPNSINLGSQGVIPVAILSSEGFDATTVDASTVELAGAGVAVRGKGNDAMAHAEDVDGDGRDDLVLKIVTENLDPERFQGGFAFLIGKTFDGVEIEGIDEIAIVPDK
jgi:hypothetical protein